MLHSLSKDAIQSKRVRHSYNSAFSSCSTTAGEENSMNVVAVLTRSFQVTGVESSLDDLKNSINRVHSTLSKFEQRLSRIEDKVDIILEKCESLVPKYITTPGSAEFIPKGASYNELSCWIRTAIGNLMVQNIKWDFQVPFNHPKNILVTNKILEFVGSQVSAKTRAPWTHSLSHRELNLKIGLVFRRKKGKLNMPSDKKAALKKANVRKTRRVTKNKHRMQILEHELFGPAMREFFGDDVGKLLTEQLQSDEESTDSEMGEAEKTGKLRVIRPSWRSKKAVEAFKKFDEYDIKLRKNSRKERESRMPGRTKVVNIKQKYLDGAPEWAKV